MSNLPPIPPDPALLAPGCPEGIRSLDLTRPAMLEASAGTGKTYAIEHLVLRLLTESEGLDLGWVLVLTYTDKATGELKEKIRARLGERSADASGLPSGARARLREAFLNFDRACVFTIHGFCQRVLRNYAFENRALFHQELADDKELIAEALTEEMRSTWLSDTGPGGPGLDGFRRLRTRMGLNPSGKWRKKWEDLARSWNPFRGDILLPEPDLGAVAARGAALAEAAAELARLAGDVPEGSERMHPASLALAAATYNPPGRKKPSLELFDAILGLARRLGTESDPETLIGTARDFLNLHRKREAVKEGFAWMEPASWAAADDGRDRALALIACMERIRTEAQARKAAERQAGFAIDRAVIDAVRERAGALKRERGTRSYDDMIQDLCAAIDARPELVAALRAQFRYCIVDEFQDTDPLQWRIFKRVFLESGGANPLYLIGDPKQAIYGFRGGDVHTYLSARDAMRALSLEGKAAGLGLDANFRSSRKMIEACNRIFSHPGWFRTGSPAPGDKLWRLSPASDPRGYAEVRYGGHERQRLPAEGAEDAPIVLRDFTGESKKGPAQRRIHQWIVSEILTLAGGAAPMLLPDGKGGSRPADWGDICVLFRSSGEKKALEAALRKAGIPFQVHKVPGLYRSDAAVHFLAVLKSLEDPSDPGKHARALLTRFFRAEGDPVPGAPPGDLHPVFESWRRLADQRKWQRLIRGMLYDTGLLYRESLQPDGERRVMDFLHLGQNLVRDALKENLSLQALVQRLREGYSEIPDEEDERHLHREDSESRKVALMTMHKSKGLEFPVVFIAALTEWNGDTVFRYHRDGATVFNLDDSDDIASRAAAAEADDELRRLYYVGLTRAKFRMYLPVPPPVFWKSPAPLGAFVAEAIHAALPALPGHFRWATGPLIAENRETAGEKESAAIPAVSAFAAFPKDDALTGPGADFRRRRRRLSSYSWLVRKSHAIASERLEGRYDKEGPSAAAEPVQEAVETPPVAPSDGLPGGKEVGNFLHAVLEDADFGFVAGAESPEILLADPVFSALLRERMEEHRVDASHAAGMAGLVWSALRTPIPDPAGGTPFPLGEVRDRRPEMEFLFPHPGGGYLWGYIDLVFRHQGRYYLLDWKSNRLPAYGSDDLEIAMRESRYDLQYMLYAMALDKWLQAILPGYGPDRDFGGVCYIYLRGMGRPGEGAFTLRPGKDQLHREYPAVIAAALAGADIPSVSAVEAAP